MSDLDAIGRHHAEIVKSAVAEQEPPPLTPGLVRPAASKGWVVALTAAVAVVALAVPLLLLTAPDKQTATTTPAADTSMSSPQEEIDTPMTGWEFTDVDLPVVEGATYAVGDEVLFAWNIDQLRAVDLRDGSPIEIPSSPLASRSHVAMVWTGAELVLYGGHSKDESFVDGAILSPSDGFSWKPIAPASLDPSPYPSVAWTGTEMVVWMADSGTPGELPDASDGQVAAYNPSLDTWRNLQSPPVEVADAALFANGERVTLVGGPEMRPLGVETRAERMLAVTLDTSSGTWEQANRFASPVLDSARAAAGPDDSITVFVNPDIYMVDDVGWHAVGPVHNCPDEIAATSVGGQVYLNGILDYADPAAPQAGGCTTYLFNGSVDTMTRIVEWNAIGRPGNASRSAFIGHETGLTTLTTSEDGRTVLGSYTPQP